MATPQNALHEDKTERVYRTVTYIEEHLGDDLTPELLADIACYSRYHFHRLFVELMAMTPGEYILSRRLERAVHILVTNKVLQVEDVAVALGFSSASNFCRAFKKRYGYTPRRVRETPCFINPYKDRMIDSSRVHICKMPGLSLMFERQQGFPQNLEDLGAAFGRVSQTAAAAGALLPQSRPVIITRGIPTLSPPEKVICDLCMEVRPEAVTDPRLLITVAAGAYAVYTYTGSGDLDSLTKCWTEFYVRWMRSSGLQPASYYGYTLINGIEPFSAELCLPIRP